MEVFLRDFLKGVPDLLRGLLSEISLIRQNGVGSEERLAEIFRQLHTLKGASAIHDLRAQCTIAHEIETIIHDIRTEQIAFSDESLGLIEEGLQALTESFELLQKGKSGKILKGFSTRVSKLKHVSKKPPEKDLGEIFPPEILGDLSTTEKDLLNVALLQAGRIALLEISFGIGEFENDYKMFHGEIAKNGSVIATFPLQTKPNKIGFKVLFFSRSEITFLQNSLKNFNAKIILKTKLKKPESHSLKSVLEKSVWEGQRIAQRIGKEIKFKTKCGKIRISEAQKNALNVALMHLIRNSVDHGIELLETRKNAGKSKKGSVFLNASINENKIAVQVIDDGGGIDVQLVKQIALQRGLLKSDEKFTLEKAKRILFSPGFSTILNATELSGRGIGLDVVENAVQKINGELKITSEFGKGATFEIILPIEA